MWQRTCAVVVDLRKSSTAIFVCDVRAVVLSTVLFKKPFAVINSNGQISVRSEKNAT